MFKGFLACLPLAAGVAAYGFAFGIFAAQAGLGSRVDGADAAPFAQIPGKKLMSTEIGLLIGGLAVGTFATRLFGAVAGEKLASRSGIGRLSQLPPGATRPHGLWLSFALASLRQPAILF